MTLATARRALANGDGSEVQLLGDARVVRPANGKEEAVEFRGEFLHAFRNVEQVRSHLPVVVTQGTSVVRAAGMEYDNLARSSSCKGRSSATLRAAQRSAADAVTTATGRWSSSPVPRAASARRWRRASTAAGYRLALVARRSRRGRALGRGPPASMRPASPSTPPTCATSTRSSPPAAPASPPRACPTW